MGPTLMGIMPVNYVAYFNARIAKGSLRAQAWGSRTCSASFVCMAAMFGRKVQWTVARLFTFSSTAMVERDTKYGKIAFAAAVVAALIGVCVLIGWSFQIGAFKTPIAGTVAMNPATALAFILAGASLGLSLQAQGRRNSRLWFILAARGCAAAVALIGLLRLAAIIFGWDVGVDQWLFPVQVSNQLLIPSRIAPNAAICFFLLGSALLFAERQERPVRIVTEIFIISVGFASLLAVLGYVYGVQWFYRVGAYIPMAVNTGIAFIVVVVAFLLSHTDNGLWAIFATDCAGGTIARRLLPAAVLVPAGLGWLTRQGERGGFYPMDFGEALFAVGNIVVLTVLVAWSVKKLFRADAGRKIAEESLQHSQTLARMAGRLSSMGGWSVELPRCKVLFSDEVCAIHEVAPGFAPTVEEAIHFYAPEFRASISVAFETCVRDGTAFDTELQIITGSGRRVWVRSIGEAERDANGVIRRVQGAFQDISQRKAAEAETRALAGRLTTTLESLTDGFFTLDREWRFTYVNLEAEKMFKHSREELLGNHIWAKFPEAQGTLFQHEYERAMRDNTAVQFESFYPAMDSWFDARAYPSPQGLAVYFRDITAIRQAGEAVRLLSSAVEQSKESIVITDAELDLPGPRILFVNPAFTKMTGYTAEEAIGKTPRILQGPRTDRSVMSRLRHNLQRDEAFAGETINYRKDGKEFGIEWQIAPIRSSSGNVTHFVAIQRDITERKSLEAQLFQSQKMETVGKLAGGIAHEFNSILTTIMGHSELLSTNLPARDALRKSADEIRSVAERAATLTRQLLAYGRKQILRPEILDLNSVLADMEITLRHLMRRGGEVRLEPAAGLQAVKADAGQIEHVIMNMAMNAADAMTQGGTLTLGTSNVTLDQEYVTRFPELKPGEYVMLSIKDTGTGMSEEIKGRIFEPFFTTKGVGEGTGLGLSTCYGIIKQSGGHVSVQSEVGRGTIFKIYLPPVKQKTTILAQHPDSNEMPRGTETILLVEDDSIWREMSATLLGQLGYRVLEAANGLEALNLQQQSKVTPIDLLITMVGMSNLDGMEFAKRVRQFDPNTRILFTSTSSESTVVHQQILHRGGAYLQKPFTPSRLAHKLREVLDEKTPNNSPHAGHAGGLA